MTEVNIAYHISISDMRKYYFRQMLKSYKFYLYVAVVFSVCMFKVVKNSSDYGSKDWQSLLILSGLFLAVPFIFVDSLIRKSFRELSKYGSIELVFTRDGIKKISEYGESLMNWSAFTSFEKYDSVIILNGHTNIFLALNNYSDDEVYRIMECLRLIPIKKNF